jgi:hypothetical protein
VQPSGGGSEFHRLQEATLFHVGLEIHDERIAICVLGQTEQIVRRWARDAYAELSEQERNWHGADLEAAREACPTKLDFAHLLPEVDRRLG